MLACSFAALLALAASANAIMVTYPGKRDTWSTSGSQTIMWDSVLTDATNFDIVLVNQDSSYLARTTTLAEKVSTSDGKATVSFPGGNFPAGQSFQVNLVRSDRDDSILAQSPMFDIVQSNAAVQTTAATQAATTTAAGTTAAMGTTTANSLPKTLSQVVSSEVASASSAAASAAAESGGVSIPAGNTTKSGAFSTLSSSALLVVGAAVVGAATLF